MEFYSRKTQLNRIKVGTKDLLLVMRRFGIEFNLKFFFWNEKCTNIDRTQINTFWFFFKNYKFKFLFEELISN